MFGRSFTVKREIELRAWMPAGWHHGRSLLLGALQTASVTQLRAAKEAPNSMLGCSVVHGCNACWSGQMPIHSSGDTARTLAAPPAPAISGCQLQRVQHSKIQAQSCGEASVCMGLFVGSSLCMACTSLHH